MRDRVASLFPLALLIGLAALTFWVSHVIQGNNPRGLIRHDPDFVVDRFTMRSFDATGQLRNTFSADKMLHYPDDDTTEVSLPRVVYHQQKPVTITARAALVSQNGKQVDLIDDVRVVRQSDQAADSLVTTSKMTVFPDAEKALSREPVSFTQGKSIVTGSGIDIDNKAGTIVLLGRVAGTIHRNEKK